MMGSKLEGIMRSRFPKTYERIQERERERKKKRQIGPRTKEGKFVSKPQEYTKEEYIEEVVDPAIEEHEEAVESIDPFGTYVYKDKWGQDTFVSGQTLLDRYEKEGTLTELKEHREEVKQLHPKTVFKETKEGYKYHLPAGTIEKEKYERLSSWEKPVVDFFAPFSQFISGVGSIVTDVTGGAITVQPSGKRFRGSLITDTATVSPTLFDVVPWNEKWRQQWLFETIRDDPSSLITMGAGEGFAFASIGYGLGKTALGVKKGVKFGIRKAPEYYSKFTKVFPEEKLLESGRSIGGGPIHRFTSRFGQTKTWRTMSRWSTGDIVKVRGLPLHKTIRYSDKGLTSRLDIYKGFGKSEWVPSKVLQQAQSAETFHIHKYTHWGTRYQSFVTETVYPSKGHLWWKTAKRQITTFAEHESMIKITPSTKISVVSVKKRVVSFSARDFLSDTRGTMQIHRPVHYRPMVHTSPVHSGYLGSGNIVTQVPISGTASLLGVGLLSGLGLVSKTEYRSELLYKPVSETARATKVSPSQVNLLDTGLVQVPISASLQSSRLKTKQLQKHTVSKATPAIPLGVRPVNVFRSNMRFFPVFPLGSGRHRQRKHYLVDDLLSGYKFRKFESKPFKYKSPIKI